MTSLNFEQAKQYAMTLLERELDPHLIYHSLAHTRDDVVAAVERLAELEGVQGEALTLLLTAAWYHDLGYVEQTASHEMVSARIAGQMLPGFGFSGAQIDLVQATILATSMPQSPLSHLEQILVDADLDSLGRTDFMLLNQILRLEFAYLGKEYSDPVWYADQIRFLENHRYYTQSASRLRDPQKLVNLKELENRFFESAHSSI
ncbi:MAG TPA: hypothetical protein VGK00_02005 [Anaerolineales bacterium]|jgi:uncharacterized protein